MPQMGGAELLEALQERESEIPVVVVSGHPMRHFDGTERIEAGTWLQKPVDLNGLGQAVAGALRRDKTPT
jgi:FixJ family two-component response regulator